MNLGMFKVKLSAPFPKHELKWRIGATNGRKSRDGKSWEKEPTSGLPLAYIDARAVMDRLDDVVGPDNWSNKFFETPTGRVICELTVLGVTKSDGAGATDMEGDKGGLSDAFKRAAVHFGIGRYLYSPSDQVWVPVIVRGRTAVLKGAPPDVYPYAEDAKENVVQFPKKPKEEEKPEEDSEASQREKAISSIHALFKTGIETVGGEEFLKRANGIIDHGYGGGDWKELPMSELRGLYKDIATMINHVKANEIMKGEKSGPQEV